MSITAHSYWVLSPVAFTVHLEPYKMLALLSFVHLDSFHRILCRPLCLGHRCNMSTFSLGKKKKFCTSSLCDTQTCMHAQTHMRHTHARGSNISFSSFQGSTSVTQPPHPRCSARDLCPLWPFRILDVGAFKLVFQPPANKYRTNTNFHSWHFLSPWLIPSPC